MRNMKQIFRWMMVVFGGWVLSSCSSQVRSGPPAPLSAPAIASASDSGEGVVGVAPAPAPVESSVSRKRTGIATGWGRELESAMTYSDFVRAGKKPNYLTSIRYNDREGAKAMGVSLKTKGDGMQKAAGGLVEWGMSSSWGSFSNYWWRGGRFVVGKKGREYQLKVKNLSQVRLEVVLSVDGLDVIDGKPASVKKRGYVINPGKTLVVKGFRTSHEEVAAFRFSSVPGSYANLRHGNVRNVGVVGLAVFTEKGRQPWTELVKRGGARAFAEEPNVRARGVYSY